MLNNPPLLEDPEFFIRQEDVIRMKGKSVLFAAAAVVLAIAMISCGKKEETETPAANPAATPAGKPVDTATAGTVTGSIKLEGTAPRMKVINMAAEPSCAKE